MYPGSGVSENPLVGDADERAFRAPAHSSMRTAFRLPSEARISCPPGGLARGRTLPQMFHRLAIFSPL